MKYLAVLLIPFFIMSCALEKEESDFVNGVFYYTTASVKIDSIINGIYNYTFPPACIDFTKGSGIIKYTMKSNGHHGPDVDDIIKKSYIRFDRVRLYLNNIHIDIDKPQDLIYNDEISKEIQLTKSMIDTAQITDGKYRLEIEMVASEFNGNGYSTGALSNTFSGYFGDIIISSVGKGCNN